MVVFLFSVCVRVCEFVCVCFVFVCYVVVCFVCFIVWCCVSSLCHCVFMCLGAVIVVDCVMWYGMFFCVVLCLCVVSLRCLLVLSVCGMLCGVALFGALSCVCVCVCVHC